jgi:hypothetical protein
VFGGWLNALVLHHHDNSRQYVGVQARKAYAALKY